MQLHVLAGVSQQRGQFGEPARRVRERGAVDPGDSYGVSGGRPQPRQIGLDSDRVTAQQQGLVLERHHDFVGVGLGIGHCPNVGHLGCVHGTP